MRSRMSRSRYGPPSLLVLVTVLFGAVTATVGSPADSLPEPARELLQGLNESLQVQVEAARARVRAGGLAARGVEQLRLGRVEEARLELDAAWQTISQAEAPNPLSPPRALLELESQVSRFVENSGNGALPGSLPSSPAAPGQLLRLPGTSNSLWLVSALRRLEPHRSFLEEVFEAEGVPSHLIYLSLVESAFDPAAVSAAGAGGVWQLMPSTARRYGLRVDSLVDERRSLDKSTRAAARYLKDLHGLFGDWTLALAAYNAGEGRIQTALRASTGADFWGLRARNLLPSETAAYVPRVLAAAAWAERSWGVTGR